MIKVINNSLNLQDFETVKDFETFLFHEDLFLKIPIVNRPGLEGERNCIDLGLGAFGYFEKSEKVAVCDVELKVINRRT